jgi:hypothetical protein
LEVAWVIVSNVAVNMVDDFAFLQVTPNRLLCYDPVRVSIFDPLV